ncbi:DUF6959 family protein [Streptomyces pinistramenti]|uniref:DUF6959 family protein n=1 Tax=Streptomyces pinistramenti TaxID=2884812 RepID=UPI003559218D
MVATTPRFACLPDGTPGVVQGDSLHILRSDVAEVVEDASDATKEKKTSRLSFSCVLRSSNDSCLRQ